MKYYTLKEALDIVREIDPRVPKLISIPRWRVNRCIPGPITYSYDGGRIGLYSEEVIIALLVTTKLNKDCNFSIYEIANAYATFRNMGTGPSDMGQLTIVTPTNETSTDRALEVFLAYKKVREEIESMLREKRILKD